MSRGLISILLLCCLAGLSYGQQGMSYIYDHDMSLVRASRYYGGGIISPFVYPTGLIYNAHLDMDWIDVVGGDNGTPVNGASFTNQSKFGLGAAAFNTSTYVTTPNTLSAMTGHFSISMWVKAAANIDSIRMPIAIGFGAPYTGIQIGGANVGYGSAQNGICIEYYGGGYATTTNGSFLAANDAGVWRHIVVTYDGSQIITEHIYKDGVEQLPLTDIYGQLTGAYPSAPNISLNARGTDYVFNWSGLMDEIAIFNRALTASEVSYIYNQCNGKTCAYFSGSSTSLVTTASKLGISTNSTNEIITIRDARQ